MKVFTSALTILSITSGSNAFVFTSKTSGPRETSLYMSTDRRGFVRDVSNTAAAASLGAFTSGLASSPAPAEAATQMWKQVPLFSEDTLYDIDFDR